jgi:lysophospholipase L1-like esterase
MRRLAATLAALALVCSSAVNVAAETPSRLCSDYRAGTFTVENLGDSVAAGYGVPDGSRWFELLGRQLPSGSAVWNGAVSGSVVGDYLPGGAYRFHVEFVKAVKPTVVIMNWRINDQWMSIEHEADGYSLSSFTVKYHQLLSEIRAASPNTTIILAVSPWVLDTRLDSGRYSQWDFINALWELKTDFNTDWSDWTRFMPKAGESNSAGMLQYDLGHPSLVAQPLIAAHVFEHFASYCRGV